VPDPVEHPDAPHAPATEPVVTQDGVGEDPRLPPWPWIWRLFLLFWFSVGLAMLVLSLIRSLRSLIVLLVASLFLSFALEPAVSWLAARGWRRGAATFACLAGLFLGGIALLVLMVPVLLDQLIDLVEAAPEILDRMIGWANDWLGLELSSAELAQDIRGLSTDLGRIATDVAGSVFGIGAAVITTVFQVLTIALFTFFLVAEGPRFRRAVCSVLPPRHQRVVLDTWELGIQKTGGYLYSRLILAVLSGVGTYIVMRLLGVEFALPLAVWVGLVSQFIPTIGTYIAMALPLLVAFVNEPVHALILLIYFTAYQQLENYILSPKVTARTMELHPALAFGSVIAGASIAGAVGAFLAIPAAAIIQALVSAYVRTHEVIGDALIDEPIRQPPKPATTGSWKRLRERLRRAG
jgi:predicted PurR-regulated permease PerM